MAPRLVAGALVAVVLLLVGAAAPEALEAPEAAVEVAGVAAAASRPEVVEAAASRPADRAAEAAHRQ